MAPPEHNMKCRSISSLVKPNVATPINSTIRLILDLAYYVKSIPLINTTLVFPLAYGTVLHNLLNVLAHNLTGNSKLSSVLDTPCTVLFLLLFF